MEDYQRWKKCKSCPDEIGSSKRKLRICHLSYNFCRIHDLVLKSKPSKTKFCIIFLIFCEIPLLHQLLVVLKKGLIFQLSEIDDDIVILITQKQAKRSHCVIERNMDLKSEALRISFFHDQSQQSSVLL